MTTEATTPRAESAQDDPASPEAFRPMFETTTTAAQDTPDERLAEAAYCYSAAAGLRLSVAGWTRAASRQRAAVRVPQPARDGRNIDAGLDAAGRERMPAVNDTLARITKLQSYSAQDP